MSGEPEISRPLRPLAAISRPTFAVPAGAWDVHVHIFGAAERYPHVAQPHYTLPDGNLAQYQALMPVIGMERFVIVQPSFYGTDNSCLLDTLDVVGNRARRRDDRVRYQRLGASRVPPARGKSRAARSVQACPVAAGGNPILHSRD